MKAVKKKLVSAKGRKLSLRKKRISQLVVQQLCEATGGSYVYAGREHESLSRRAWYYGRTVEYFGKAPIATLDNKFKVGRREKRK